jgi:hypothetical protein
MLSTVIYVLAFFVWCNVCHLEWGLPKFDSDSNAWKDGEGKEIRCTVHEACALPTNFQEERETAKVWFEIPSIK